MCFDSSSSCSCDSPTSASSCSSILGLAEITALTNQFEFSSCFFILYKGVNNTNCSNWTDQYIRKGVTTKVL